MTTHCPQGDDYAVLFEDGRYECACSDCVEFEKERPHVVQVVELGSDENDSLCSEDGCDVAYPTCPELEEDGVEYCVCHRDTEETVSEICPCGSTAKYRVKVTHVAEPEFACEDCIIDDFKRFRKTPEEIISVELIDGGGSE